MLPELVRDAPVAPAAVGLGNRLAVADGLRGVAAMWVVLFHASEGGHLELLKARLPDWFVFWVFGHGELGVPIFFVLSGFVMALTVHQAPIDVGQGFKFIARRLIRLTPPMYFSFAVVIGLAAVKAMTMHTGVDLPRWQTLLAHATYTHGLVDAPILNPIYWTLGVEVQFYAAFALLVVLADAAGRAAGFRQLRLGVFVAAAVCSLAWPFNLLGTALWVGGFLPFWYAFIAGLFAYWANREIRHARAVLWLFLACLGMAVVVHHNYFTGAVLLTAALLAQSAHWPLLNRWFSGGRCSFSAPFRTACTCCITRSPGRPSTCRTGCCRTQPGASLPVSFWCSWCA
jgi:peptidoglycan/LPS O-acetylase OafA/YrhL